MLRPELASTSPPRKRFIREARTAAAVTHENIVGIYAVEEDPVPYLVMEFVPGQTLQARLNQKGPLEISELLTIALQVARGLAAAHKAKLIHRDIKPANILLTCDPVYRTKISDFGLARAVDDASLTSSGVIAGTPLYMAPEQARGETLDNRADLFSLGSVMYQMACGRPPFRASTTMAVLKRVCEDTPRPIKDLIPEAPEWLCAIIDRLLEKDRDDRFQTADEVVEILERCQLELLASGVVSFPVRRNANRRATSTKRGVKSWKRGPRWLIPVLLSVAVIPILYMITVNLGSRSATQDTLAEAVTGSVVPVKQGDDHPQSGWHGWPANAPKPAIAPFDAAQARRHQEEWAKYLNVDVEYTNSIGMKFMLIPPGEFTMGSTPEEVEEALKFTGEDGYWQKCVKSEAPQHKVILTKPIYLGVNEVTQAEYEKVMGVNPSTFASMAMGAGKDAVAGLDTTSHPVETVSWNDAAEFCAKLSKQEELKPFYFRAGETITPLDGTGYRLPTEAEWEYACRAGTTTKFWTGDQVEDLVRAGWFNTNSGRRTHAAGELKANPYGLFDIHGNVLEWVEDWWEPTYYGEFQEKPAINPIALSLAGSERVIRGGNWFSNAYHSRSANRYRHPIHRTDRCVGFRVAIPFAVAQTLTSSSVVPGEPPANSVSDTQMLDFVRSTGGRLTLGEPPLAGISLTAIKNPRPLSSDVVHFDFRRSKLNLDKHFGDEQLTRLAELLKLRPDIKIGVLNLVVTNITNKGLLSLGQMPIEELLLENTNVMCDEIAEQLAEFPVADWDFGDKLTSKGLEKIAKNPYLRGISLDSKFIGLQSLSALTNSRLERLQLSVRTDRPLPDVPQLTRLTSLKSLYLPGPGISKEVEKFKASLPGVLVQTTRYANRLPRVPQYPENDLEIISLVESFGGEIHQYRPQGLIRLISADYPSLTDGAINIRFWDQKAFDDNSLIRLAELIKTRPDLLVICFHFPGTSITNNGLRSLQGIPLSQVFVFNTEVNGDELANEAEKFQVGAWGNIPNLSEKGLLRFLECPYLAAIEVSANELTPPVVRSLAASTIVQIRIVNVDPEAAPAPELLSQLDGIPVLVLASEAEIPQSYLEELHNRLPYTEIQFQEIVLKPTTRAAAPKLRPLVNLSNEGRFAIADTTSEFYRLQFRARRSHGEGGFAIHLPVGRSDVGALFTGFAMDPSGGLNGLAKVDDIDLPFSPDRVPGDIFKDGKDHHFDVTVHPTSVTVKVDGKPIIAWNGDSSRLKAYPWLGSGERSLFVQAFCGIIITHAELEPIEPPVP